MTIAVGDRHQGQHHRHLHQHPHHLRRIHLLHLHYYLHHYLQLPMIWSYFVQLLRYQLSQLVHYDYHYQHHNQEQL